MLDDALAFLNETDVAALPADTKAHALRTLERAESRHTAARARILAAFTAHAGYEADGQGSARAWLRWHTRVTNGAAAGAVGWMRRLRAHPVIAAALAAGDISASWARDVCGWTDRLPAAVRGDADEILAAAARAGLGHTDLAGLAQEMFERTRGPDTCPAGFGERAVWLGATIGGAGRLTGDLTPGATAALTAVLDALGKRAGPDDLRTAAQRRHDALAEACDRLLAAGLLPGAGGKPAHAQVHLTMSQLRDLPGAPAAEAAWAAAHTSHPHGPAGTTAGDATDTSNAAWPADPGSHTGPPADSARTRGPGVPAEPSPHTGHPSAAAGTGRPDRRYDAGTAASGSEPGWPAGHPDQTTGDGAWVDGNGAWPAGCGAWAARDRACPGGGGAWAGEDGAWAAARASDPGWLTGPEAEAAACEFHHLTAIHSWGWTLRLNPDGTTTATSPDHTRTLHSHSPPQQAA